MKWWLLALAIALSPTAAFAAEVALYVVPERGTFSIGETFDMRVLVDTDGQSISSAEAEINYNPTAFLIEEISTEGSILELWATQPNFSKEKGLISFSGSTDGSFQGTAGLLITVKFKALRNMAGNAFISSGAVLSSTDSSNIITSMRSGVYTVEPRHVVTEASEEVDHAVLFPSEEEIEPPILSDYPESIEIGERIVLRGTTLPNARISIWVEKGSEQATDTTVWSAADGSFVYVSDAGVEADLYRVWAEVHNYDDLKSAHSKKIALNVRPKGFAAVAASGVDLIGSVFPLLLLLIVGGLCAAYLVHMYKLEKARYHRHGGPTKHF